MRWHSHPIYNVYSRNAVKPLTLFFLMSHLNQQKSSDPLLGGPLKANNDSEPHVLSSTTKVAINALAAMRIATGAICLVAPRFTFALFKFAVPVEQALLVRNFGGRDAVLGGLVITAEDGRNGGRREMKRALWAGIIADVLDAGSLTWAVARGQVGTTPGGLMGVAVMGAIALGVIGLRGL
ncbi:hypothetical protein GQ44DRAFT_236866 [Phaeosphaeriaceae sp. PMI808]|nr:hypothetical protein GQ44DRAFT_236866 [Phaeosphaeriaceae sp. PMI808]